MNLNMDTNKNSYISDYIFDLELAPRIFTKLTGPLYVDIVRFIA